MYTYIYICDIYICYGLKISASVTINLGIPGQELE